MARLFNAYVIVDWSAASKPVTGENSIWIGVMRRDVRFRFGFESFNPSTRAEAEARLVLILDDLKKRGERVLLGFDFPLGYPRGLGKGLALSDEHPWSALWDQLAKMVTDKPTNVNNRFAVGSEINRRLTGGPFPFWGVPKKDALTTLQPTRARPHTPDDLPEFRHAELAAKGASSVWKLNYPGTVGGQAILGIPAVRRLKKARGDAFKVWPFETGWKPMAERDLDGVEAVAAEIYPSLLKPVPMPGEIKDQAQVRTLCEHFARLDEAGKLGALFGPADMPAPEVIEAVEREEGWILGA